jgi:tungstate transport system permease protein
MGLFIDSLVKAVELIVSLDPEIVHITLLSIAVSFTGVFFAALFAMPLGILIGLKSFRGKRLLVNIINTFMGLPPVVVGLFLFLIFSNRGLLGSMGMLFTPGIMALAQFIIAFPIIAGVTLSAIEGMERDVRDLIRSLGTTRAQTIYISLFEIRYGLLTALMSGLGRAFSEVGAVIIVGGNIRYHTRVLTTSIVLESSRGDFEMAMALGIILLALAFITNYTITLVQERGRR